MFELCGGMRLLKRKALISVILFSLIFIILGCKSVEGAAKNFDNNLSSYEKAQQVYKNGKENEAKELIIRYLKELDLEEIFIEDVFVGKVNLEKDIPSLVKKILTEAEIQEIIYKKAGINLKKEAKKGNIQQKNESYFINFNNIELEKIVIKEAKEELGKSIEKVDLNTALTLQWLIIEDINIKDLSKLKLFINLYSLNFHNVDIHIENWNDLNHFRRINIFDIINGKLKEISFLKNLNSSIEYLSLKNNQIKDLSTISYFNNIRSLNLSYNQIKDLSPLNKIKEKNIDVLLLNNNNISRLQGLEEFKIRRLNISNNPLVFNGIKPIKKLDLSILKIDRDVFDGVVFAEYPDYIKNINKVEFVEEDEND
jgi:hypothetical protein